MAESPLGGVRRPDRRLLISALISSFAWGPLFPLAMVAAAVRFRTLEYRFDAEGVHASWGILFRREITLAYSRIQDLHLTSNPIERWLGLARIEIQTASGSSTAEMTIEGLRDFEQVRDELAARMRRRNAGRGAPATHPRPEEIETTDPLLVVADRLAEVGAELRALREALGGTRAGGDTSSPQGVAAAQPTGITAGAAPVEPDP